MSFLRLFSVIICMRTFAHSVAIITLFATVTRFIGFVFKVFLSRILGAELLGVYQIAMSFFMVFLTIVASGLPLAISKQVATGKTKGVIKAGFVLSLIASVFLCLLVFLFQNTFSLLFTDKRCIAILIALLPSLIAFSVYSVIRAVWWGEKKFALLGVTELIEQVVRVIMFVIMLALAFFFVDMLQIAALSYTVASFIGAFAVVIIFIKTKRLPTAAAKDSARSQYKPLLRSAVPITLVRTVSSIAMPVISVLILKRLEAAGWSATDAVAGFGIIMGMTMPLFTIPQTVISAMSTALVPELSSAKQNKNNDTVNQQIQNALKFTVLVNFLLLPIFMAVGEGIGIFVYKNYLSGVYLAQFAWVMIPMSLNLITNAILNSLGAETRAMKHYLIGAVALFGSIWFLPSVMGIGALVVGIGSCFIIASILNLFMITKLTSPKKHCVVLVLLQCLALAAVSAPAVLFGQYIYGMLLHVFPLFINLAVSGAVTGVIFVTLCLLFNIISVESLHVRPKHTE